MRRNLPGQKLHDLVGVVECLGHDEMPHQQATAG
jgi:hypothetical protein